MKWTNEQVERLTELCYAGTSNADMAKEFEVPVTEIHAKRSALGITIPKCKAGRPAAVRNSEKVLEEIERVKKAMRDAEHKIDRCHARLAELEDELEVVK